MGLSSKQVSSDGLELDWSQTLLQAQTFEVVPKPPAALRRQQQPANQQQGAEALKCPRCESTNTKFCYYNNYNKSQPRHFCKACKRHWTKGGTLRNVPVGGGRKNKRHKKASIKASAKSTTVLINNANTVTDDITGASCSTINTNIISQPMTNIDINIRANPSRAFDQAHQQQQQKLQNLRPLALGDDQKSISDILYQALIGSNSALQFQNPVSCNNLLQDSKSTLRTNNIGMFTDSSTLSVAHNTDHQGIQFSYTSPTSSSFDDTHPPTSFQFSNAVFPNNNTAQVMKENPITITTSFLPTSCSTVATTTTTTQPWQVPSTSSGMDMASAYWNWDDFDTFAPTDLNIPWDDPDNIK